MRRKIVGQLIAPKAISLSHFANSIGVGQLSKGVLQMASGALTSGNANAYAFAWQNPEAGAIIIQRVILDITTAGGTGSSVIDVGRASSATTNSDNLLDGVDANAAAVSDSCDSTMAGTNGRSIVKLDAKGGTNDYITGRILVANAASLVGKYYIFYMTI